MLNNALTRETLKCEYLWRRVSPFVTIFPDECPVKDMFTGVCVYICFTRKVGVSCWENPTSCRWSIADACYIQFIANKTLFYVCVVNSVNMTNVYYFRKIYTWRHSRDFRGGIEEWNIHEDPDRQGYEGLQWPEVKSRGRGQFCLNLLYVCFMSAQITHNNIHDDWIAKQIGRRK